MRIPVHLAVLAVLASGCLGGRGGAPTTHPRELLVTVPDVVHRADDPNAFGVSVDSAGAELHRSHLKLAVRKPVRLSGFWSDPVVESQSPAAGARVPAGTPVRLAIRQEPGPSICVDHRLVVPDDVGETLAHAERSLGTALTMIVPPLPPSSATRWKDAYRVSSQAVAPGTRVAPCTAVRIRVRLA